jgi:hypothetical protein
VDNVIRFCEYVAFTLIYFIIEPILLVPNLAILVPILILGMRWVRSDVMSDKVIIVPMSYSFVMATLAHILGFIK